MEIEVTTQLHRVTWAVHERQTKGLCGMACKYECGPTHPFGIVPMHRKESGIGFHAPPDPNRNCHFHVCIADLIGRKILD